MLKKLFLCIMAASTAAMMLTSVMAAEMVADFDTYSILTRTPWAGFKNTTGDYSDYIKSAITDNGKEGKGLNLYYQAATWYSGYVFCTLPANWDVSKDVNTVEFDYKGKGEYKIALETENFLNGKKYDYRIALDSKNEWKHVSIPISDFLLNGANVNLPEVVGIAFQAGENGGLNNAADETKAMSAEDLTAAAKVGNVVIDNLALTKIDIPTPTADPDYIGYTFDFESPGAKLYSKSDWSGFKNSAEDYSDDIAFKVVSSGGNPNSAMEISYRSATWYSGEIFLVQHSSQGVWKFSDDIKYIEMDVCGKGSVKMSMDTNGYIESNAYKPGVRYEQSLDIDTNGEWKRISIPFTEFKNKGEGVPVKDITAITFTSGENAGLNNNADETKTMSADDLNAVAKTGKILFDNMTICSKTNLPTERNIDVRLEQNGNTIENKSQLTDGVLIAKADFDSLITAQNAVLALAVYDGDGVLEDISISSDRIIMEGMLETELEAFDIQNKKVKIFLLDRFSAMNPLSNVLEY